jgi:hypothetical protein
LYPINYFYEFFCYNIVFSLKAVSESIVSKELIVLKDPFDGEFTERPIPQLINKSEDRLRVGFTGIPVSVSTALII